MRNLKKYPITVDEIKAELLERINAESTNDSIGCLSGVILRKALNIITAADEMRYGIEQRFIGDEYVKWITPWAQAAKLNDAFNDLGDI